MMMLMTTLTLIGCSNIARIVVDNDITSLASYRNSFIVFGFQSKDSDSESSLHSVLYFEVYIIKASSLAFQLYFISLGEKLTQYLNP